MTQWPTRLKNLILSWLVARLNPSQWKESSFPQHERSSLTGKMLSRETAKVELITVWGKVNYRCSHWHKQQRRQQPLTTAASSLLTQPDSHWGSRQPDASNTFWNHGFREQGEGGGRVSSFLRRGVKSLGVIHGDRGRKMQSAARPACCCRSSGGNPFLSLQRSSLRQTAVERTDYWTALMNQRTP